MWRRLKKVGLVFVVVLIGGFAAAQLVRPARTNPPTDHARTIQATAGSSSELIAVLDRACNDCHSNGTVWARYSQVAPVSWLISRGVAEGRKALNFSEWGTYSAEDQQTLLATSCDDATKGTMPMRPYLMLRPEARLSASDVATICSAARQAEAQAASNTPARGVR
ncbi:MAG TPA: heme-binding domain-containing protein [Gemmatimonadaceae bacterium]|nr:heme-binding domain-containing protein [Gemmatimonadaceae bacterium]